MTTLLIADCRERVYLIAKSILANLAQTPLSFTMSGSMIRSLDESVVALSMLGSRPSVQKSQNAMRSSLSEVEHRWCCLLDELSWLCDYRTGGKSVTSIAAQTTVTGNIFWFANNKSLQLPVQRHLQWLLQVLQSHVAHRESNARETHWKLFQKSVVFNRRRIEHYHDKISLLSACLTSNAESQNGVSAHNGDGISC